MKYFDLHCDTATVSFEKSLSFDSNMLSVNSKVGKSFTDYKQCFAIFINENKKCPFEFYKNCIYNFKNKLKNKQVNLTPIFTVEGGIVIEDDISRVYTLYNDGIKTVSLTWNGETTLAGGVNTESPLKPFGIDFLKELNSLNIACDLSHLNTKSFYGAIEYADNVIATHSNCFSVCPHKRNLTDEQLLLIKEKQGIVGLCVYPLFLGGNDVFEDFYKHLYHILDLGLENNVSIGSDFDGADMDKKLSSPDDMECLYKFLNNKGIEISILNRLFYENADNFFLKL